MSKTKHSIDIAEAQALNNNTGKLTIYCKTNDRKYSKC